LPTAANSTPVLAASGNWVVAVWTASEHERTDIYAATSEDGAEQFGAPVRVNDVEGEAHVYGEDPPRVAIVPSVAQSQAVLPEIVVTGAVRPDKTSRVAVGALARRRPDVSPVDVGR